MTDCVACVSCSVVVLVVCVYCHLSRLGVLSCCVCVRWRCALESCGPRGGRPAPRWSLGDLGVSALGPHAGAGGRRPGHVMHRAPPQDHAQDRDQSQIESLSLDSQLTAYLFAFYSNSARALYLTVLACCTVCASACDHLHGALAVERVESAVRTEAKTRR